MMPEWYKMMIVAAAFGLSSPLLALPPLGLTRISDDPAYLRSAELAIYEGNAYVGSSGSVWKVGATGVEARTQLSDLAEGTPNLVTQVVRATDGNLYVGASIWSPTDGYSQRGALYDIDQPESPIQSWLFTRVVGVSSDLRVVGNGVGSAYELNLDGTTTIFPYPCEDCNDTVSAVSASGIAVGSAGVPDTLGSAAAKWTADGVFSFIDNSGFATSIAERNDDANGVNIGLDGAVKYGESEIVTLKLMGIAADVRPIVSGSEFLVARGSDGVFAYHPGIAGTSLSDMLLIEDVFSELSSIDVDRVADVVAVNNRVYMTITGDDGLFLFGAPDPSIVPEPSMLALCLCLALIAPQFRMRNR